MKLEHISSDIPQRKNDDVPANRPWRKHATPLNKQPSNPDYPTKPFDYGEWLKGSKKVKEDSNEIPEPGDVIRTKKMQMQGKVEKLGKNRAGYDEVFFRVDDGRLMVTPLSNVIVIEKLADEENSMMEDRVDEISTELLAKYKTAAGKDASAADKSGDFARGNKRFSGIVKATKKQFSNDSKKNTKEGTMGGINRSAPAVDVSYEKVLDEVRAQWEAEKLNELSVDTLQAYKNAAVSPEVVKHSPLRKVAKHLQGAHTANQKIKTKTGDRTGIGQPGRGEMEETFMGSSPTESEIEDIMKRYGMDRLQAVYHLRGVKHLKDINRYKKNPHPLGKSQTYMDIPPETK